MNEPNLTIFFLWAAAAVLIGAALFWAVGRKQLPKGTAARTLGIGIPLGIIGARLLYVLVRIKWFIEIGLGNAFWPVNPERFYWGDAQGFALWGAIAGVALGAWWAARKARISAGTVLDELAAPGLLVIALCRFGEYWNGEGVGRFVENESLWFFPLAIADDWSAQYAVFMAEGIVALVIFGILMTRGKRYHDGYRARLGLLLYSACQILLESLRMDNYLSWQFLRISQLIAALVLLGMMIAGMRRKGKTDVPRLVGFFALVGVVVYLEFAVDKSAYLPVWACHALEALCCVGLGIFSAGCIFPKKADK